MPKHKPARKSPSLDMTAMCDVAFLLLTFFMLTAKMKPQEAVVVDTPSSISETKLPDAGTLVISISKDGRIFLDMAGSHTRSALIADINARWQLGLSAEDAQKFANVGAFGVPKEQLRRYLQMDQGSRGQFNNQTPGIPCDTIPEKNELATWVHQARLAQFQMKREGKVDAEYVIVVKADKDTPYPAVQRVLNTLTDINVNKFNLITSLESDPNKLAGVGKKPE